MTIKKLAVEACRKDEECGSYIRDTAKILNALYSSIAAQYSDSQADIEYHQDQLYKASLDPESDTFYGYIHEYLNATEVIYNTPNVTVDYLKVQTTTDTLITDACQ